MVVNFLPMRSWNLEICLLKSEPWCYVIREADSKTCVMISLHVHNMLMAGYQSPKHGNMASSRSAELKSYNSQASVLCWDRDGTVWNEKSIEIFWMKRRTPCDVKHRDTENPIETSPGSCVLESCSIGNLAPCQLQ